MSIGHFISRINTFARDCVTNQIALRGYRTTKDHVYHQVKSLTRRINCMVFSLAIDKLISPIDITYSILEKIVWWAYLQIRKGLTSNLNTWRGSSATSWSVHESSQWAATIARIWWRIAKLNWLLLFSSKQINQYLLKSSAQGMVQFFQHRSLHQCRKDSQGTRDDHRTTGNQWNIH